LAFHVDEPCRRLQRKPRDGFGHGNHAGLEQHGGNADGVAARLTVLALRDGVIPTTLNLRNLDPEIDLHVVAGTPRQGDYQYAINNSSGFGGHNVALAFGKY
jgi:beta-ketoacyl ACP synthase